MLIALAALVLCVTPAPVFAASITADGATCSFHDAITAANTNTATNGCPAGDAGADIIELTYDVTLTQHLDSISESLTINGNGNTVDGANAYHPFTVHANSATVIMNDLTVTKGRARPGEQRGAGIYLRNQASQNSTLTLNRVKVTNNYNQFNSGVGGGLSCLRGSMTINDSVISHNDANSGGGIYVACPTTIKRSAIHHNTASGGQGGGIASETTGADITVINSSIFANTATGAGGLGGGIAYSGSHTKLDLRHVTITGNSDIGGESSAGGVRIFLNGNSHIRNSIIWGNTGNQCHIDYATLATNDRNIYGSPAGSCGAGANSVPATNFHLQSTPKTDALTPYFNLPASSPAINAAGDCSALTTEDQRGRARPSPDDPRCDIGAFEYYPPPAPRQSGSRSEGGDSQSQPQTQAREMTHAYHVAMAQSHQRELKLRQNIDVYPGQDPVNAKFMSDADAAMVDQAGALATVTIRGGVDLYGWISADHPTIVCFPQRSYVVIFKAEDSPRTLHPLATWRDGDRSCASVPFAGTVFAVANSPASMAWFYALGGQLIDDSEPAPDQAQTQEQAPEQSQPTPAPVCTVEKQSNEPREDGSLAHIVQPGDCLWMIAIAYDLPFRELMRLNDLEWNASLPPIMPGQEIIVRPRS